MSNIVATLLQSAGLIALSVAAGVDFKTRIIPNELVVCVIGAGLGLRLFTDGWMSWISLVVAIGVFLPLGLLAQREIIGGGDAKMITASTFLVAPAAVPQLLLAIALAGGAIAVAYLAAFRALGSKPKRADGAAAARPPPLGLIGSELARIAAKEPMPYGLAILAGSAFVVLS
jgi:prepilin peptidase CpaA